MSETYRHGIYTQELDTALTPMIRVVQPIYAVGTAEKGPVNQPTLIYSKDEYVKTFGYGTASSLTNYTYTLDEVADVMDLYGVSPVVMVNVYDPDGKHSVESGGSSSAAPEP